MRARVDLAAFDELVLRYRLPLLRYFAAKLGDWADAEDLAQEVLLELHRKLPEFAPRRDATFRSWLFAIAHHKKVDVERKRNVRRQVPFPEVPGWADPAPTPEDEALRNDAAGELRRLLDLLTPDQRAVMQLRAADLETKEIAAALRTSEANVRKHQERAIARLRAQTAIAVGKGGRA